MVLGRSIYTLTSREKRGREMGFDGVTQNSVHFEGFPVRLLKMRCILQHRHRGNMSS